MNAVSGENEYISHYQIIIIGGGPIGLACGIEAVKANISYLIIEKGCIVNSIYNYPRNMTFFSTAQRLELDDIPFISAHPKPHRDEALEYYRRVAENAGLNIHLFETVQKIEKSTNGDFSVITTKNKYFSKYVIIATGFYDTPYMLHIPGENLTKVKHYYDDPHYYAFQKVAVIGGMNSAIDAALETWRKGAEVTLIIRQSEIGERVKYWVRPDIINRINEGAINAYFDSEVVAIYPESIDIKTPDGLLNLPNDWVLAMTGYQPNLNFLESCGVKLDSNQAYKPDYDTETYESNVPGLYLAGVICGGLNTHKLFIENSRIHAILILRDIVTKTHSS